MTDQSTYDAGVVQMPAPATELAPEPVAAEAAPSAATPPAGAVTLTAEQFKALLAAAQRPTSVSPAVAAPIARVAPADALKVGDTVLHKGRAALILEVLTSDREEGEKTWVQVSYRVGVFAEDRTLPAEDFGAF